MTTEEDFQKQLDEDPDDWQCRLVFADWLEEHGDVRAEGYRALGLLRVAPRFTAEVGGRRWWTLHAPTAHKMSPPYSRASALPLDWYALFKTANELPGWDPEYWCYTIKRSTIEDAAARAFSQLTEQRRADIMKGASWVTEPHS